MNVVFDGSSTPYFDMCKPNVLQTKTVNTSFVICYRYSVDRLNQAVSLSQSLNSNGFVFLASTKNNYPVFALKNQTFTTANNLTNLLNITAPDVLSNFMSRISAAIANNSRINFTYRQDNSSIDT